MRGRLLEDATAIAIAALLAWGVQASPFTASLCDAVADWVLAWSTRWPPRPPHAPDAAVVAIDAQALQWRADWPWPRTRYAQLIEALDAAGARAIAFDIDFSTPRAAEDDTAFARAIARSGHVVLGAYSQRQQLPGIGELELESFPIPELRLAATALGSTIVPLDRDGVVRRVLGEASIGRERLPSLARATWQLVRGREPSAPSLDAMLDYRRLRPPVPVVSIADVLDLRADPAQLRGRAVFVGATAPILQDLWTTPVDVQLPGVLIQALEYRQHAALDAGQSGLRRAGALAQVCLALVLSLLVRASARRTELSRTLGFASAALAVMPLATLATVAFGWLFSPLPPLAALAAHYALGLAWVRARAVRLLGEREGSIAAMLDVGRLASEGFKHGHARVALGILAERSGALALWLLEVAEQGELSAARIHWTRRGTPRTPNAEVAREVLARRSGHVDADRHAALVYLPLVCVGQPVGVLVAAYPAHRQPRIADLETLAAVGGQIALALTSARLITELREEVQRAQAATRAKTEFLANMSHEIRTPMTVVLGALELLENAGTDALERGRLLATARRNGEHLLSIINDILDLARIEAGRLGVSLVAIDPAKLCSDLDLMFRPQVEARGLRLEIEHALLPTVLTDPARVRQILVNLVGNAVKFSERGCIRVRARYLEAEGTLDFEVSDEGIGMDSATLARLFEPFSPGDGSSTRAVGGTGLGLAISKRLAGLLGGTIEVNSAPGTGTAFRVVIPAAREALRAPETGRRATPRSAVRRVLLAEDGPDVARIIRHFLVGAGCEVEVAENGQQACERALAAHDAGRPHDLILMDIDMPVMDGYEATRRLRASGLAIPIVALTAHALASDRQSCMAAGCSDYASKPIARQRLLELIELHCETRKD